MFCYSYNSGLGDFLFAIENAYKNFTEDSDLREEFLEAFANLRAQLRLSRSGPLKHLPVEDFINTFPVFLTTKNPEPYTNYTCQDVFYRQKLNDGYICTWVDKSEEEGLRVCCKNQDKIWQQLSPLSTNILLSST